MTAARLAYADPPYPGQAQKYRKHHDFNGEVDHGELIQCLDGFDGWALSTSMVALREVISLCPNDVLVAAWVVTDAQPPGAAKWRWWYCWEPLIVRPARSNPSIKNALTCSYHAGEWGSWRTNGQVIGMKPRPFCEWLFGLLGADATDTFTDLFPGSGAVTKHWDSWSSQTSLAVSTP